MLLKCQSSYHEDDLHGNVGLKLTVGGMYTFLAQISVNDSPPKCLVISDSGTPGWAASRYFDTAAGPSVWPFSSQWGIIAEHSDDHWWRVGIAHRDIAPFLDRLDEVSVVGDDDLLVVIENVARREMARDSIVLHLHRCLSGEEGWQELVAWARLTLEESSPKAFLMFSDEQIEVLAELSALDGPEDDPRAFVESVISRL